MLSKNFSLSYSGDIISNSKTLSTKTSVNNFSIALKAKNIFQLIKVISQENFAPIEFLNYIDNINLKIVNSVTKDKKDNKIIAHIKNNYLRFSFETKEYYKNIITLLNNLPNKYFLYIKMHNGQTQKKIYDLKMYNNIASFMIPHTDGYLKSEIELSANTHGSSIKNIKGNLSIDSDFANVKNMIFNHNTNDTTVKFDFLLKNGFFNQFFAYYDMYKKNILHKFKSNHISHKIAKEIEYIKKYQKEFDLTKMENVRTNFQTQLKHNSQKHKDSVILKNTILSSRYLNIKANENIISSKAKNIIDGIIEIKNYIPIINFTSNYIYKFNKHKKLPKNIKQIYIDINKKIFAEESKKQKSSRGNIIIKHKLDLNNIYNSEINNKNMKELINIYKNTFYQEFIKELKINSENLDQFINIIPGLKDKNILQKIVPKIEKNLNPNKIENKLLNIFNKIKKK
jgi:hypothetical protein